MRKILLFAVFVITASSSYAQLNRGQWILGGQASIESRKSNVGSLELKSSSIELSPDAGYFFADKLTAGVRGGYIRTNVWPELRPSLNYSFAPFIRYYILSKQQKTNIFADASYGFSWSKESPSNSYIKFNAFTIQAGPSFFLTPNVALEFTLGYMSTRQSGSKLTTNTLKSGLGFKIHLGNSNSKMKKVSL